MKAHQVDVLAVYELSPAALRSSYYIHQILAGSRLRCLVSGGRSLLQTARQKELCSCVPQEFTDTGTQNLSTGMGSVHYNVLGV